MAERVDQFFGAAAADGIGARGGVGGVGNRFPRLGGLDVVGRQGPGGRLGLADGGAVDFFRDPARFAGADRRIHRPHVSDGESTTAVGGARSGARRGQGGILGSVSWRGAQDARCDSSGIAAARCASR